MCSPQQLACFGISGLDSVSNPCLRFQEKNKLLERNLLITGRGGDEVSNTAKNPHTSRDLRVKLIPTRQPLTDGGRNNNATGKAGQAFPGREE